MSTSTHRTRQVAVRGGTLSPTAIGQGPRVLLIHGTAPAAWGDLPESLAHGHTVIAYDRRSFGVSGHLPSSNLAEQASDAVAILDSYGPATLLAWSIGGVIALEVAARRQDLVQGLVLIEPPFRAKRHPRPGMVSAIAGATLLGKVGRHELGAQRFLRWALQRRDEAGAFDAMPTDWHDRLTASDARAVIDELAAGTGEHLDRAALAAIAAPVHVLRGGQSDPVFAAAAARTAAVIPQTELIDVPDCGHAIQLENPECVAASVDAILARGSASRPPSGVR